MGSFSLMHWIVVLAIVLILFGAGKLPRVMGDFAKGIKAFKAGMQEGDEPGPGTAPAAQVPPPAAAASPAGSGLRPQHRPDRRARGCGAGPIAAGGCRQSGRDGRRVTAGELVHRLQSRWAAGAAEAESANGDASAPSPSGGGTLPRPVLTPRAANPDPRSPCFALEMSRDRRDDDCVYFLLHIPKTAGQTLQQHFARHCAPGAFWQTTCRVKLTPGRRAAALPDPGRARVIAGHQLTRAFAGLFFGREIRPIVLLRDPLELQISLYNWQMMNNIAIGLGTYSFALHLRAQPVNFIAHFLLTRWLEVPRRTLWLMSDEAKYEAINRAFAGFWFVGAHRDCDRLIATLAPALGVPPTAPRRNTSAELQAQTG